jgi:hypothetical protein
MMTARKVCARLQDSETMVIFTTSYPEQAA